MPAETPFVSPLAIAGDSPLLRFRFGDVRPDPAIEALRRSMNAELFALAGRLPPRLAEEARAILTGYCGDGDFFRLFYVPTWSFLLWSGLAEPLATLALRGHAASLFLHLWDDHLADGQLAPDLLRLQMRSLAHEAFLTSCQELAAALGAPDSLIARREAAYLETAHCGTGATDLESYARAAMAQMAIWSVVPALIDHAKGSRLEPMVEAFIIAWRLIDDVQDAAVDAASGQENAVWYALDARPGLQATALIDFVITSGAAGKVADRAQTELERAAEAAEQAGLGAYAQHFRDSFIQRPGTP